MNGIGLRSQRLVVGRRDDGCALADRFHEKLDDRLQVRRVKRQRLKTEKGLGAMPSPFKPLDDVESPTIVLAALLDLGGLAV